MKRRPVQEERREASSVSGTALDVEARGAGGGAVQCSWKGQDNPLQTPAEFCLLLPALASLCVFYSDYMVQTKMYSGLCTSLNIVSCDIAKSFVQNSTDSEM